MAQRDAAVHDRRPVPGGEYADWESIYEDNADWLYRTIFARVANRPDTEDLSSEVLLTALRRFGVSASVPEVRAHLRFTARSVLAAHWRATFGYEVTAVKDIGDLAPDSEDAISSAPRRVPTVLAAMPYQYRRIVELRFLRGCSIKDCAVELGVSVTDANVLQHRAMRLAAQAGDQDER